MKIRVADIVDESIVDGPGIRMTIFMQGCPHHCAGCHNPSTHDPNGGREIDVAEVIEQMRNNPLLDGITFSGGEPFEQKEAVYQIAKEAQELGLNVWCYTGYTWEDLVRFSWNCRVLAYIDVLVDGRFELEQRTLNLPWRGSANQRVIDATESLFYKKIVEWEEQS